MVKKLGLVYVIILLLISCKSNNIQINGNVSDPTPGKYILLEELMSDTLVPVDSVAVTNDGKFAFSLRLDNPAFYLLKFDNTNYLTMLLEPGQKIEIEADAGNLNYPESVAGSPGTEQMVAYNHRLREAIDQIAGLSE